jgi:hypothetical protein
VNYHLFFCQFSAEGKGAVQTRPRSFEILFISETWRH